MSKNNKKKVLQTAKQHAANIDKQYQIKEVLDVRFNTITGVKQYKIQWEPCEGKTWKPTWEPEQLLGKVALIEFFQQKKKSKQLKEKKKHQKKKKEQQKIIKEYESRLNAEIELFQKRRGVSYQKIKQIRQNRNRTFETLQSKSQIFLDQKKNGQNSQTRKNTNLQTYDFLIDKIFRPHKQEHQEEYFQVLLKPTGQKRYVSQFTLTKFFPNAFMKYLEEQQFQANENFNKFRKVQNNQNFLSDNQFQFQMQKARRQNRCKIQIEQDPQIKAKLTTYQQYFPRINQQNINNIFQQSESIVNQKAFDIQQNKNDQLKKKILNKDQTTVSHASSKMQKKLNISTDSKTNQKRKKANTSLQKIDQDFNSMFQNEKNQNLYYSDED